MLVRNAGSVTGPVSAYMSLLLANERITTLVLLIQSFFYSFSLRLGCAVCDCAWLAGSVIGPLGFVGSAH